VQSWNQRFTILFIYLFIYIYIKRLFYHSLQCYFVKSVCVELLYVCTYKVCSWSWKSGSVPFKMVRLLAAPAPQRWFRACTFNLELLWGLMVSRQNLGILFAMRILLYISYHWPFLLMLRFVLNRCIMHYDSLKRVYRIFSDVE
jgi:hypothetical protein